MAATSAMASAPESPLTPTPLQLKNIFSRTLDIILSMGNISNEFIFGLCGIIMTQTYRSEEQQQIVCIPMGMLDPARVAGRSWSTHLSF